MRKIQLDLDTLSVESFGTAEITIEFLAATQGGGPNCGSAVDACPSARGCTVIGCV